MQRVKTWERHRQLESRKILSRLPKQRKATPGPPKATPGLPKATPGLPKATPGLPRATPGLLPTRTQAEPQALLGSRVPLLGLCGPGWQLATPRGCQGWQEPHAHLQEHPCPHLHHLLRHSPSPSTQQPRWPGSLRQKLRAEPGRLLPERSRQVRPELLTRRQPRPETKALLPPPATPLQGGPERLQQARLENSCDPETHFRRPLPLAEAERHGAQRAPPKASPA